MSSTPTEAGQSRDQGRDAERPGEIPPRGWKHIARRVKDEIGRDQVGLLSAGVAFYGMLALFPALIAAITSYGLVADPRQLEEQIASTAVALPSSVQQLLRDQLARIIAGSDTGLSLGVIGGLVGVLWSASAGMQGLLKAISAVYDEEETRPGWKLRAIALALTLVAIVGTLVAFALVAVFPALLDRLGLPEGAQTLVSIARWVLLGVLGLFGLALLYRYGPDRDAAKWRWVTWGSAIAVALWITGSALFSLYVANFGKYNETYGSLGAVIVLLLWLFLSAFVVLLGAEINSEMEHRTARDTTRGPRRPMGQRGAYVADTVA